MQKTYEEFKDPFVDEIHKIRRELAEEFDFDLKAIFDDLKKEEKASKRKIVKGKPKLIMPIDAK